MDNISYEYLIRPLYDLSMTLVVANICKDGTVISSDRLAVGTIIETGEPLVNQNMIKTHLLGNKIVYGFSGKGLVDFLPLVKFIDKMINPDNNTFTDNTSNLLAAANVYLDLYDLNNPELHMLVVGKDEIRQASLVKSIPSIGIDVSYASIGYTDIADSVLNDITIAKKNNHSVKKLHQKVFNLTAKKYPKNVGKVIDSWLINDKGIIRL